MRHERSVVAALGVRTVATADEDGRRELRQAPLDQRCREEALDELRRLEVGVLERLLEVDLVEVDVLEAGAACVGRREVDLREAAVGDARSIGVRSYADVLRARRGEHQMEKTLSCCTQRENERQIFCCSCKFGRFLKRFRPLNG